MNYLVEEANDHNVTNSYISVVTFYFTCLFFFLFLQNDEDEQYDTVSCKLIQALYQELFCYVLEGWGGRGVDVVIFFSATM